tara:strand:- start:23707 stop:25230 length:1524 start_codon:yes stop_codon:yes gene_type:complete
MFRQNRSKLTLGAAVSVFIAACSNSGFYDSVNLGQESARETVAEGWRNNNYGAAYSDTPVAHEATLKITREAPWLSTPVNSRQAGGVPAQMFMESIGKLAGVRMIWGRDVDPYMLLSGEMPRGSVKDALEWVSANTGYAFSVDEASKSITWSKYLTQSFNVSYLGGSYDYQIGSTSKSGSGGSGSDASTAGGGGDAIGSFAANENSFSSVSGSELDVFADIKDAVTEIVGESGTVAVSRSTGTAVVTATPATMGKVEGYFDAIEEILSKQIMLDVKIVRFTGDQSHRAGINWGLVRDSGNDVLEFTGSTPGQNGLGVAPVLIDYLASAGSNVLLEVLDEFGDVSIVTEPRLVTQSNRVVELELGNITGYLGESEVTSVSSNSSVLPAVDLEAAYVEDGYFLFALAKVGNGDNVVLHLASRFQDLLDIARKEAGASAIETPSVSRNRFVQTVVMRNGSTLVLNALRQEINENGSVSPLNATSAPTFKNGRKKIVETLVLVTPVIIDMS